MGNIKKYSKRDSATAFLRKNGVSKENYDKYIHQEAAPGEDAVYCVNVALLNEDLSGVEKIVSGPTMTRPQKPLVKKEKSDKKEKTNKAKGRGVVITTAHNVSNICREMIINGFTNEEVWDTIKDEFNLDDNKKYYPSWYRCELRRRGAIK